MCNEIREQIEMGKFTNKIKSPFPVTLEDALNGENFQIERSTIKHETRKGEVYASTGLKLYKASQDGDLIEDITEEITHNNWRCEKTGGVGAERYGI